MEIPLWQVGEPGSWLEDRFPTVNDARKAYEHYFHRSPESCVELVFPRGCRVDRETAHLMQKTYPDCCIMEA